MQNQTINILVAEDNESDFKKLVVLFVIISRPLKLHGVSVQKR